MPTDSDFHITKAGANNPHWEEIQGRVQENSVEERGKPSSLHPLPALLQLQLSTASRIAGGNSCMGSNRDCRLQHFLQNGMQGLKSNGKESPLSCWAGGFAPIPALEQQLPKEAKISLLVSSIFFSLSSKSPRQEELKQVCKFFG